MLLLELRRFDEAVEEFAQLVSKYPDHPQAYAGRAIAFAALGNSQGAKEDTDRLGKVSPEMVEEVELQTKAAALYSLVHKYDYDGAFASAEQIIAQYPEKSLGYRLRGYVHWEREEYVEAVDDYSQVLKIDGPRADCLSSRGQLLAELGEYQRALADLDESIAMAREAGHKIVLAYALNGRALAFSGMGRDEDSTRDFGESVGLCPTNPWVYYHRGIRKFQLNQWNDAKNMLQLALDLKEPPLSKRKILRAEAVLKKIASDA
jgi:tetratricopeptide (TPR) repeat protein